MKFGIPISILTHCVVGLGGLVLLPKPKPLQMDTLIVPVELVSISEDTNVRATVKATTPIPSDTPMTTATPMDNAPEQGDAQTRVDEPQDTPDPIPTEGGDSPAPQDVTPKPPEFDLDKMAALINRTRDTQEQANQQIAPLGENIPDYSNRSQTGHGAATGLTVNEATALKSKMYQCWNMMAAAKDPDILTVKVRVRLRSNGTVRSADVVNNAIVSSPFLDVARANAVNAVIDCAPYDFLPSEKYDSWRDMILTFKPDV